MKTLIDLGWCMARLDTEKSTLMIVSPSEETEGRYTPAESIVIGEVGMIALRDALNTAYPPRGVK